MDAKNERYIVNGSHDAPKLQSLLGGFIRKFVVCTGCNNPETNLVSCIVHVLNHVCTVLPTALALYISQAVCGCSGAGAYCCVS